MYVHVCTRKKGPRQLNECWNTNKWIEKNFIEFTLYEIHFIILYLVRRWNVNKQYIRLICNVWMAVCMCRRCECVGKCQTQTKREKNIQNKNKPQNHTVITKVNIPIRRSIGQSFSWSLLSPPSAVSILFFVYQTGIYVLASSKSCRTQMIGTNCAI